MADCEGVTDFSRTTGGLRASQRGRRYDCSRTHRCRVVYTLRVESRYALLGFGPPLNSTCQSLLEPWQLCCRRQW